MQHSAFAVDMGGTSTRVAVISNGTVLDRAEPLLTRSLGRPPELVGAHLDAVADRVTELRGRHPGELIDLGVAIGATVTNAGTVTNAAMLWGTPATGLDLVAELERRIPGSRVRVSNDINAAAWRYRHLERFAIVTISTGVAIKVFDDRLPDRYKLLTDADGLGGESGHVAVAPPEQGRAAARCECGELDDLCSHTSGPGMLRAAAAVAFADPRCWQASVLHAVCEGDPTRLNTRLLAGQQDDFVAAVLAESTQHLAVELLRVLALLGLRRIVVTGGIPRGFGDPWYRALISNMSARLPRSAWFTGWTAADVAQAIVRSSDDDDVLLGMAALLEAQRSVSLGVRKVVGSSVPVLSTHTRQPCGPEQFEIAVRYVGICGTDRQIIAGERSCNPGIIGHEAIGTVTSVGSLVSGLAPGDVVTVNPNHPLDGWDKLGHNQPGLLRQYALLSDSLVRQGRVVVLPASALAPEWVLIEPLSCVVNSIEQVCGGQPDLTGRRVLVVGAGVAALLHVLACQLRGAEQVLITNRSPERLRLARERGLLQDVEEVPFADDAAERVLQRTGRHGVDILFLCVSGGGADLLKRLWLSLAPQATGCLFGGFLPGETIQPWAIDVDLVRRRGFRHPIGGPEVTIVGTSGARRDHVLAAAGLLADPGDVAKRFSALVTHHVALDAAPGVLRELATAGTVASTVPIKVVIDLARTDGLIHRS